MTNYGYVSINGAGTGSNIGTFKCSLRANNRIIAAEFDAISSIKVKTITASYDDIKEDIVERFSKVE